METIAPISAQHRVGGALAIATGAVLAIVSALSLREPFRVGLDSVERD